MTLKKEDFLNNLQQLNLEKARSEIDKMVGAIQ